jgi:hypothetical protein
MASRSLTQRVSSNSVAGQARRGSVHAGLGVAAHGHRARHSRREFSRRARAREGDASSWANRAVLSSAAFGCVPSFRRYASRRANWGYHIAYVYSRATETDAMQAKVLTEDEARRVAANIARLPDLLGR